MQLQSLLSRFKRVNKFNGESPSPLLSSSTFSTVMPGDMSAQESSLPLAPARDRISYGNSVTARGELRWHIFCAHSLNIILLLIIFLGIFLHQQILNRFAEYGYVVYAIENGHAMARPASDFRNTATDEEIQALAVDVVLNVLEAGSDNIDENFNRAERVMTPAMKYDFERILGSQKDEIKRLQIYRKLENATLRVMDESDLPVGSKEQVNRYEVFISGRLDTYRLGTTEVIATGPVSYRVQMVPLPKRTRQNPSALLVSSLDLVKENIAPAKSKSALEKPSATATKPEPAEQPKQDGKGNK